MSGKKNVMLRVWDLPTRLFHWALVLCLIGSYTTVKLGGLWMQWHVRFGLVVLGLILFRLVWGFIGPHYARFAQFVKGPRTVWAYLRTPPQQRMPGHNPLASWSVLAMLAVIGFQGFSGLFADDDIFTSGPLAHLSSAWSTRMTGLHHLNEWLILALVALHLSAVGWYQWILREPIVSPMIVGDANVPAKASGQLIAARDDWSVRIAAAVLGFAIGLFIWWLTTLGRG